MRSMALFTLDPTTADRFDEFHRNNPDVYRALVRLARQWIESTGNHRLGIKSLFERVRWEMAVETTDAQFRIDNTFAPYYSRLIMAREVDLADMFACRRSEAD